ncbi:MAG TPA: PHP domain-containing protein [Thermomicrobiales bacterium]|nr:PHP domain-containing protein [Thermomicrobiales bacterium]
MLVDYHMHLEQGPFAPDWLARFLAVARERGVAEIGVTEHIYRFAEAQAAYGAWWERGPSDERGTKYEVRSTNDERRAGAEGQQSSAGDEPAPGTAAFAERWWTARGGQSLRAYAGLLRDAAESGLPVRCGIEVDYFPGSEAAIKEILALAPFDYAIGSVHWLGCWGFDLLGVPGLWDGRDVDEMYRRYFATLGRAARSGLFQIMAHPDLIKVMGHRPSPALDLAALYAEAAAAFAAGGAAVEVSTAGLRKPVGELYPAPAFLRACRERGVPLSLASDAHRPEDVGRDFPQAVALARACGYREVLTFAGRQARAVPLG